MNPVDPGQSEEESSLSSGRDGTAALNLALGHGRDFTRPGSLFRTNKLWPGSLLRSQLTPGKGLMLATCRSFLCDAALVKKDTIAFLF